MQNLPNEILLDIFESGLDYHDLKCLFMVHRHFKTLLETPGRSHHIDKVLFRSAPLGSDDDAYARKLADEDFRSPFSPLGFQFHPVFKNIRYDFSEYIENVILSRPLPRDLTDPKIAVEWQRLIDLPAALENACEPAVSKAAVVAMIYSHYLDHRTVSGDRWTRVTRGYGSNGAVTVLDVVTAFMYATQQRRLYRGEPLGLWRRMYYMYEVETLDHSSWCYKSEMLCIHITIDKHIYARIRGEKIRDLVARGVLPKNILEACTCPSNTNALIFEV